MKYWQSLASCCRKNIRNAQAHDASDNETVGGNGLMFESCFSERAQRVLARALAECEALHHSYFDTEHVLLGVLAEQSSASLFLNEIGISIESARYQLERMIGRGRETPKNTLPIGNEARRALALGIREARADGYVRAEPIHLLRQPFDDEVYSWSGASLVLRDLGLRNFQRAYARAIEVQAS